MLSCQGAGGTRGGPEAAAPAAETLLLATPRGGQGGRERVALSGLELYQAFSWSNSSALQAERSLLGEMHLEGTHSAGLPSGFSHRTTHSNAQTTYLSS